MKEFEYKIVSGSNEIKIAVDEPMLNELGAQGWEIVGMYLGKGDVLMARAMLYWLKRETKD